MTGTDILKLRKKLNWTQQQLADELYVTREAVAYWESGKHQPNRRSRRGLALLAGKSKE